jgi:hypothetical protein
MSCQLCTLDIALGEYWSPKFAAEDCTSYTPETKIIMIKSHLHNSFSFRIEDDFCNVFVQVLALAQTARFLESLKLMLYRAQTTTTFFSHKNHLGS